MHLGDSIFIFILALVLFGPKKLPEMARQIGKLMAEFRRASNDFRLQIDEELRTMERQEQQKKQEVERTAPSAGATAEPNLLAPLGDASTQAGANLQILPPALGQQVSAGTPYAVSASTGEVAPAEDHPLLRVDSIPADPRAQGDAPTGLEAAQANAALLDRHTSFVEPSREPEQATLQNG